MRTPPPGADEVVSPITFDELKAYLEQSFGPWATFVNRYSTALNPSYKNRGAFFAWQRCVIAGDKEACRLRDQILTARLLR